MLWKKIQQEGIERNDNLDNFINEIKNNAYNKTLIRKQIDELKNMSIKSSGEKEIDKLNNIKQKQVLENIKSELHKKNHILLIIVKLKITSC